jgi:hypothetical protein
MADQLDVRSSGEDVAGAVGAAIINHQHFIRGVLQNSVQNVIDVLFFVEDWDGNE